MQSKAQTRPVTVELWVRSLSPRGAGRRRSATIRRLEATEGEGIEGFRVRVWGDGIARSTPAARTERGRAVLERVAEFEGWAAERGLSLSPAFEERSRTLGGDHGVRELVLPEMALAEFRAGTLRWVTPCSDGRRVYTVDEHVDALSTGVAPADADQVSVAEEGSP
jgi:hypothetical protein